MSEPLVRFQVGSKQILLPPDHNLPAFQAAHPLYDRFLPVLAAHLEPRHDRVVVDVGANVGDTLFAMLDRCDHRFLCIEGEAIYYDYLMQNLRNHEDCRDRVRALNVMLGTGEFVGQLVRDGTTASLSPGLESARPKTLDDVLSEQGALDRVALLKIDTDGLDGDIILSGRRAIARSRPPVFWENYFASAKQLAALENAYDLLAGEGYEELCIFDNFGAIIAAGVGFPVLRAINDYVASQDAGKATRTIYYTDVLAAPCGDKAVSAAISAFRAEFISPAP